MSIENPLIQLLPSVYQRTLKDPHRPPNLALRALLDVMVELQSPDQDVLTNLDTYFDHYQAPEAFVPLLASWLDLDWLFTRHPARLDAATAQEISPLAIGRLRELIAVSARFARLRGTAQGLVDFMETATNISGLAIDDHVPERSFHLRMWAPLPAEPWRPILLRMLQELKPAYATAELITAGDLISELNKKFNLQGLAIQTELQASDPRPRRIHLQVLAPKGIDLPRVQLKDVADRINELTPSSEDLPLAVFDEDAGAWKKSFREWPDL